MRLRREKERLESGSLYIKGNQCLSSAELSHQALQPLSTVKRVR